MDVAALTAFLAPLLPFLMKVSEGFGEAAAERVGKEALSFAQAIWDKLRGKVQEKDAAREAVEDVAHNPDDEELRTVLKIQLKKLLAEDTALAAEVARLWDEANAAGAPAIVTTVTASGAGSVAVGRDVSGSTITTAGSHSTE
jgi:hypothetical protein